MPTRRARPGPALTAVLCITLLSDACGDSATQPGRPHARSQATIGIEGDPVSACSATSTVELLAGRTIHAGTLTLSNDGDRLYVTYTTEDGWTLGSTALFVGTSAGDIPRTSSGNPIVGHFPYSAEHAPGTARYTYVVPVEDLQHARVIAAYADVRDGGREEGAWGAGERITSQGSWATWFSYVPEECAGDLIGPAGGHLDFDGVSFHVPAGALSQDVLITARHTDLPEATGSDVLSLVDGTAFDLGPDGLQFLLPFTITIAYDPAALPADLSESDLVVFQSDGSGLSALSGAVDLSSHTVNGSGTHFSSFAVGAPEPDPYTAVACPELAMAATSGLPLDEISIGSLPANWSGGLTARVSDSAGDVGFTVVKPLDDGTDQVIVPIHPSASPEGGAVQLRFNDGTNACDPVDFVITALPPAPGETAALVGDLETLLDAQITAMGTTRADLASGDILDLPGVAWPVRVAMSVLDEPDNPNSLLAIAQGSAPIAAGTDPTLADRLIARTGIRSALATQLSSLRVVSSGVRIAAAASSSYSVLDCDPEGMDAALLDYCMTKAASEVFHMNGKLGKVLNDMSNASFAIGLIPTPATKLAGATLWLATFELQTGEEGISKLLPSEFVNLQFQADPLSFLEDEAGPGRVSAKEVVATSKGWTLDTDILNALLVAGGLTDAIRSLPKSSAELLAGLARDVVDLAATIVTQKVIDHVGGLGIAHIPSSLFGPVDVGDPAWSATYINGPSIRLATDSTYDPIAAGITQMAVRIRNEGGQFGGMTVSGDPQEIEVYPIGLEIVPASASVKGGDTVEFVVTISNAKYPDQLEAEATYGDAVITAIDGNEIHVTYTAPSNPDVSSDLLTVRDIATTGARGEPNPPPRLVQAPIHFGKITISPQPPCIAAGQAVTFTADVVGPADKTVTWSADVGSIDASTGEYSAPDPIPTGTHTVTITATSAEAPSLTESVTLPLGCDCRFLVSVGGSSFDGQPGDVPYFVQNFSAGELQGIVLPLPGDAGQGASISLLQPFARAPGNYPVNVSVYIGGTDFYQTDTSSPAQLTLDEFEVGRRVVGSISGTLRIYTQSGSEQLAPFESNFTLTWPADEIANVSQNDDVVCTIQ